VLSLLRWTFHRIFASALFLGAPGRHTVRSGARFAEGAFSASDRGVGRGRGARGALGSHFRSRQGADAELRASALVSADSIAVDGAPALTNLADLGSVQVGFLNLTSLSLADLSGSRM